MTEYHHKRLRIESGAGEVRKFCPYCKLEVEYNPVPDIYFLIWPLGTVLAVLVGALGLATPEGGVVFPALGVCIFSGAAKLQHIYTSANLRAVVRPKETKLQGE